MHNLILVIGEDRNSKSNHLPPTLPCSNIPNAVGDSIRSVECVQIGGKKITRSASGSPSDKVFWKGKTESDCMFTNNSGEHASAKVSEAKCKTQPINETDRRSICFGGNTVSEAFNENWEDEEWERKEFRGR